MKTNIELQVNEIIKKSSRGRVLYNLKNLLVKHPEQIDEILMAFIPEGVNRLITRKYRQTNRQINFIGRQILDLTNMFPKQERKDQILEAFLPKGMIQLIKDGTEHLTTHSISCNMRMLGQAFTTQTQKEKIIQEFLPLMLTYNKISIRSGGIYIADTNILIIADDFKEQRNTIFAAFFPKLIDHILNSDDESGIIPDNIKQFTNFFPEYRDAILEAVLTQGFEKIIGNTRACLASSMKTLALTFPEKREMLLLAFIDKGIDILFKRATDGRVFPVKMKILAEAFPAFATHFSLDPEKIKPAIEEYFRRKFSTRDQLAISTMMLSQVVREYDKVGYPALPFEICNHIAELTLQEDILSQEEVSCTIASNLNIAPRSS